MSDSQAIADVFFTDLMASFKEAEQCFEPLYLAFGDGSDDSVFGVNTRPGYIFDDLFWDVFHAHPLHVCHVTRLTDGPQFDENRVFEIRFKVSEEQAALEAKLSELEEIIMANAQENLRLLSEIDDLEAKLSKMELLADYAVHDEACAIEGKSADEIDAEFCTCGFIEALAGGEEA